MWLWLKNNLGMPLTEEEYETIENPVAELYTHITLKTVQAGNLLCGSIIGPVVAIVKKKSLIRTSTKWGVRGAVFGLALGPLMTYARMKSEDEWGYWDRCYRLRYSGTQIRVDRGFVLGDIAGAGLSTFMGYGPMIGGIWGANVGLLTAAVGNMKYWPSNASYVEQRNMISEKRKEKKKEMGKTEDPDPEKKE